MTRCKLSNTLHVGESISSLKALTILAPAALRTTSALQQHQEQTINAT
jgi:hypothetical protein